MMEGLIEVSESVRQQLIILEAIRTEIKALIANNKAEGKLKERLDEYLSTAIVDIFITYDFVTDAEGCIDESDIELLLEITQDETVN